MKEEKLFQDGKKLIVTSASQRMNTTPMNKHGLSRMVHLK
jgi:hypothetical protein